ncbi:MAG: hypothetical protein DWQ54_19710 [Microcystis flos-aquae TF09]|uniref:Uncharacterized protein n=1 Tax=Microcystis flos-aquae TF09 TaxID=2060473 RepID=A0A3E0L087_9CHRO|nr:MAG: hypothetical protein DWQ54_19710 [Microcystis flos-aquae TF09]
MAEIIPFIVKYLSKINYKLGLVGNIKSKANSLISLTLIPYLLGQIGLVGNIKAIPQSGSTVSSSLYLLGQIGLVGNFLS